MGSDALFGCADKTLIKYLKKSFKWNWEGQGASGGAQSLEKDEMDVWGQEENGGTSICTDPLLFFV